MSKLSRGDFLELSVLLIAGCASETDDTSTTSNGGGSPIAGAGGTFPEPAVPSAGAGGSTPQVGGAPAGGDAGNPSQAGAPADMGSPSECAGRAEAGDFYGTEILSMEALFDNHEQPHEFYLSQPQLDEALAVDYEDETGSPIYLRFDTTVGSGPARGLDPTAPHVHPVLFGRAKAEELLAQGRVETGNAPTTDEGGIVHRHRLTVRLC